MKITTLMVQVILQAASVVEADAQTAKSQQDCAKKAITVTYSNSGGNWTTAVKNNNVTHKREGGGAASIDKVDAWVEGGFCRWKAYFPGTVAFSSVIIFEETVANGPGNGGFTWVRR
jgi:hypothetical protein